MPSKKLAARIEGSWSSYAASAFGVIKDCGMWDFDREWFGMFMHLTGICFQTIYDKKCSVYSVTAYDWEKEHNAFLQRIGITSDACCEYNGQSHPTVLTETKASIDSGRGVVLWGVDVGEFGIIYGYDDDDGVFLVSGIGGNDSQESNPILYQNLGRHLGKVLYCQFPIGYVPRSLEDMVNDSLRYYIQHMTSPEKNYGLNAYDNLLYALENECEDFGLRYTTGVYTERKQHAAGFFNDEDDAVRSIYKGNRNVEKAGELYKVIAKLYEKIHVEILEQGFDGWNHLQKPVSDKAKKAIIPIVREIASKEKEVVGLVQELE